MSRRDGSAGTYGLCVWLTTLGARARVAVGDGTAARKAGRRLHALFTETPDARRLQAAMLESCGYRGRCKS